jgi:Bacterial PH domain
MPPHEPSRPPELRVYRAAGRINAPAWVCAVLFFLISLSTVTVGPSQHDGVGSGIVGGMGLLFSLWLGAILATNRLIVTPAGLVYWNYLRRRSIDWAETRSFHVGPGRSMSRWPALIIRLNDGSTLVTNVTSFTKAYPARLAAELGALRNELAPPLT